MCGPARLRFNRTSRATFLTVRTNGSPSLRATGPRWLLPPPNRRSAEAARKTNGPGEELHALDYQAYAYLQIAQDNAAKQVVVQDHVHVAGAPRPGPWRWRRCLLHGRSHRQRDQRVRSPRVLRVLVLASHVARLRRSFASVHRESRSPPTRRTAGAARRRRTHQPPPSA